MKVFLGIDWGGTSIKAGLLTAQGRLLEKRVLVSQELAQRHVFLSKIKELVKSFDRYAIQGVGVGAPGIVDVSKGFVYYLPNIPGWKRYPLQEKLRTILKVPVFVDNDANCFGLAESRLGAARGVQYALFFTLGTGLGSAVIWQGKLLEGQTSAAELGHIPVQLNGKKCGCGSQGCIETLLGNRYLIARYRQLQKNRTAARDVKEIFERGVQGEKQALALWDEFSYTLGRFLAGMVNVFNPQVIVFGGGVSGAFRLFKPRVMTVIKEHAVWPHVKGLRLVKARLTNAGVMGAALLAKERVG